MYDTRSNLIIGFHGCDIHAAKALIGNPNTIKISDEPYDWLGHGLLRLLDCTVIEFMHARIEEQYKKDKLQN